MPVPSKSVKGFFSPDKERYLQLPNVKQNTAITFFEDKVVFVYRDPTLFNTEFGTVAAIVKTMAEKGYPLAGYEKDFFSKKPREKYPYYTMRRLVGDCYSVRVSPEKIETMARELFSQLAAVHENTIYHMDIKPQNICRWEEKGKERYCFIDWNGSFISSGGDSEYESADPTFTPNMLHPRLFEGMLSVDKEKRYGIYRDHDLFCLVVSIYRIAAASLQNESCKTCRSYPYTFEIIDKLERPKDLIEESSIKEKFLRSGLPYKTTRLFFQVLQRPYQKDVVSPVKVSDLLESLKEDPALPKNRDRVRFNLAFSYKGDRPGCLQSLANFGRTGPVAQFLPISNDIREKLSKSGEIS